MADYYTQFSCIFDVGSAENAARADVILRELWEEISEEYDNLGFSMQHDPETSPGALWIHADENGEPEHVVKFVLRCAEAMDLTGLWGFTWGLSCSKPRIDAYGGGAQILDLGTRNTVEWIDFSNWVIERTRPGAAYETPAANLSGSEKQTGTAIDVMTEEEGVS